MKLVLYYNMHVLAIRSTLSVWCILPCWVDLNVPWLGIPCRALAEEAHQRIMDRADRAWALGCRTNTTDLQMDGRLFPHHVEPYETWGAGGINGEELDETPFLNDC